MRSAYAADATASDARLALSQSGHIGAWLVAGPFEHAKAPDENQLSPRLDDPVGPNSAQRWHIASTNSSALDLAASLDSRASGIALAAGVLHVERPGWHVLLLGAGDGLSVMVDGKHVFSREEPRVDREDEDFVPLELARGDHTVIVIVNRRGPSRNLRARVLDADFQPPRGAWWLLPGTRAEDARAIASKMSLLALDRGMGPLGYQPTLTVKFPDGAPRGVHLDVHARLVQAAPADDTSPLFDVDAGEVPVDDRSVGELVVRLPRVGPEEVEDQDWNLHVEVAGRALDLPFHPRRAVRLATARADRAMSAVQGSSTISSGSLESIEHLRDRLVNFVSKGDGEIEPQLADARELDQLASVLEQQQDPYVGNTWRKGVTRRAYRSPIDGKLSEFAMYVPPNFDPRRKYPLIVALHGMNGRPVEMLMWLFGFDDPDRDGNWEDRHPRRDLPLLEAIVVAPDGYFNAMYRDLGEEDVMNVIDWTMANYPIDPARVTITGPSMGGIGTAACALHHPSRFAAAEPLCGYHSYFVRSDIWPRSLRPWEKFIAEQRSNVFWAENGLHLPLYIVHGTKDLPEENSGVLIDRYEELNYDVTHEHPDLGHNVWQTTYEDLKGATWLLSHRGLLHPRAIRFKTPRTRWADDAWLHVRELSSSETWGEVNGRIDKNNKIFISPRGVSSFALDRDSVLIDDAAPVLVSVDRHKFTFPAGEPIALYRAGGEWHAGDKPHEGLFKHGHVTGPLQDVFHEPILFVWGATDPVQARANEEVARAWARVRWGVVVDYPIMSDTEFYARGEALANDHALFLVGNAASNRLVRELEPSLPIRVDGDAIMVGEKRITSRDGASQFSQLGAAFIRPNPLRPDRYVVVVEGVTPLGTWRSLSLPDMLPDFMVFDEDIAPAGGQLALGAARARAAGFFGNNWGLAGEEGATVRPGPLANRTN